MPYIGQSIRLTRVIAWCKSKFQGFLYPGPEVIKLFSCSTQLRMQIQMLIKLKCSHLNIFLAFKLSDVVSAMLMNVKMSTIDGILTFMSMINLMFI